MNIIKPLLSSIRRRYLYHFKARYVKHQYVTREGSCDGCEGVCCKRTRKCPMLKEGKCKLYGKKMPYFCWIFPIDETDIRLAGVEDVCKFRWQ